MDILYPALLVAGFLHFGLLLASFSVPRVLDWNTELQKVNPLTRQLVLVHGGFIVLTIICFGAITLAAGRELLAGSMLGLAVAGFIGVFWLGRLLVQLFFFQTEPRLTTPVRKIGYPALYFFFSFFSVVYLLVAWSHAPALLF